MPPTLSILDFGYQAHAVELVEAAERWGYHRFWLGEHHSELQCNNPLLLGALLAAATEEIRLGSGGVCLDYQSPMRIAEDARLIELLAPDRFDLGVTRGQKIPDHWRSALLDGRPRPTSEDFVRRLRDLHAFITRRFPEGHPMAKQWFPEEASPPLWVLGLSAETARLAAELGVGFCYSLHHAVHGSRGPEVFAEYRRHFRPSPEFPEPAAILVVSGICAPTEAAAKTAGDRLLRQLPPEQAEKIDREHLLLGSPDHWGEKLAALGRSHGADELMVLDLFTGDGSLGERLEMFSLLARHLGLEPRPAPGETEGDEEVQLGVETVQ